MARRTQFALSTLNLYNFNLPGLRIYSDSDGWDEAAYARKLDWIRHIILQHPSDVWGFQELWHREAIAAVFDHPDLAGYTLLVPTDHTGQKIVCSGAVRTDILVGEPEWIDRFPEKFRLQSSGGDPQTPEVAVRINGFSRPVLHFKVRPRSNGAPISVYVAHFKSKAPTAIYTEGWYRDEKDYYSRHSDALGSALSTIRRTAEATALRMMLTEVLKGTDDAVVVLGDLNDGQTSNTLNILTGQPNYILSGLEQGGSDTALYAVSRLQQYRSDRDVYYTHIHQNLRESLDHILVSQEFYDNSRQRQWAFKGMDIVNDHLNYDNHEADGSSDHGMVRATFEYRPAKV
ncbi:endonuclease/exonuclease/phosphatase family protein [Nodosilinea nodulosa]|uniref:endonuclease/exonuclease/phosphatase family protein n=1 Tax=Nodosilinea nodulosa TaxID=416001 RepID=UPI0002FFD87A|nr:endonuclease/exonuclease/phosphatase family protein [Nodosilinea nodulosa]